MTNASVRHIFIAPFAGEPMQEVQEVFAIAGVGLVGDRYACKRGIFSSLRKTACRHATLISLEALELANAQLPVPFLPSETRRNIIIEGISAQELNDLSAGKPFRIGAALVRGVELCDPCSHPSKLSGKPGFKKAFRNRGGLRIKILRSGQIKTGDELVYEQNLHPTLF